MGQKRKPSPHQKQVQFFTILFGTLMVIIVGLLIWFFSTLHLPGQ